MIKNIVDKYLPYIFIGFMAVLYLPVMPAWIKDVVTNENNQHCMLIPFISLYIAYLKKNVLAEKIKAAAQARGNLYLFILGLIVYFIGTSADIIFFRQMSLIVLIAGAVLYIYGKEVFYELVFPILFLLFTIPIPEAAYQAFSSPMKLLASKIAARMIRVTGIPVYREGVNLFFPYASIEVVDACSGMRSLISLLAVGTAFSYFFQKNFLKRVLLVASTIPIAVFSNIVRIVLTGLIAHGLGEKYAQGFLHTLLGTVVVILIGISFILLVNFALNRFDARKGLNAA